MPFRPRHPSAPALLAAAVGLAGLCVTGLIALISPGAQARDALTLQGFADLSRPRVAPWANLIAHSVDAKPFLLLALAFPTVAVLRGRPRIALAAATAMFGAVASSELLKSLLAHPRNSGGLESFQVPGASWPSGHATAAMAITLAAILVTPRRLRSLVAAAGTALTVAVSYSILMLHWHFPSDVLGGYLVAATWTALVVAGLRAAQARWPAPSGRQVGRRAVLRAGELLAPVGLITTGAAVLTGILLVHPGSVASFSAGHRSFLIGALAIAALAWTLPTATALLLGGRAVRVLPRHRSRLDRPRTGSGP